jgi:aminodeoxyfutalosine synthase
MEMNAAIVERARSGVELTEAELLELDSADVLSLGMLADEVRRARVGSRVGFVRVLEVSGDALPSADADREALGLAQEVRLTTLADTLDGALDQVRRARERIGATYRLTGFSLADVVERGWGDLAATGRAFKAAGLDAFVDAPVDMVSPGDVAAAVASGVAPQTLSVRLWPDRARVPVLMQVRAIVSRSPALGRFAPLARQQSITAPTTGYQDVRMVALARLALPAIATIEVDWQQYGPKLAQVALMFGANHLDRVAPVDDPARGPRRASAEEVRRNIIAAGLTPAEPGEAA